MSRFEGVEPVECVKNRFLDEILGVRQVARVLRETPSRPAAERGYAPAGTGLRAPPIRQPVPGRGPRAWSPWRRSAATRPDDYPAGPKPLGGRKVAQHHSSGRCTAPLFRRRCTCVPSPCRRWSAQRSPHMSMSTPRSINDLLNRPLCRPVGPIAYERRRGAKRTDAGRRTAFCADLLALWQINDGEAQNVQEPSSSPLAGRSPRSLEGREGI